MCKQILQVSALLPAIRPHNLPECSLRLRRRRNKKNLEGRGMHAASRTGFRPVLFAALGCLLFIGTLSAAPPPSESAPPGNSQKVDFERHLMGLLGRMGCNAGSCHGSFQGKGGFRLSLFGYDPEKDYLAVTRDALGRRIDGTDPDRSLLLLKATGQVKHGGGRRFNKNSRQY